MNPATAFRLSTYLMVAVACAALGSAEMEIFPEVGVFTVAVVIALAVIYRLETRVQLLSLADANKLAAGIAVGGLLWAGYRVVEEFRHGEFASLGWPLFLVTLIAPVLMAAVAAKLLRREKHAGDYWYLHVASLGGVVLASSMAERIPSFVLLSAYTACAVWSLYHFFTARANGSVPPIPGRRAATEASAVPPSGVISAGTPWGRFGLAGTLLLTIAAGAVALPLYLLTPRSAFDKLDFGQRRIEIGYAADQMIDLNQTGELGVNKEPAFTVVAAEDDGRPKEDLSPDQRWRGTVLALYQNGTWRRTSDIEFPQVENPAVIGRAPVWSPPDFGPGRYSLTFAVPARLPGSLLADPISWAGGQPSPVADLTPDGQRRPWYPGFNGLFLRASDKPTGRREWRYIQYRSASQNPDLGPGFTLAQDGGRVLTQNPVPGVKQYADQLLGEMVRDGRLPRAVQTRDTIRLLPTEEFHETIARAFSEHLADQAGLVYTTELPPVPQGIDPIEHFLFHSRAGHCERFAAALAFMLRSQGIPAVVVLGFKGCEHLGGGKYEIRQEHAHAWVEALISRPAEPPGDGATKRSPRVWHWLSLDPTPAQSGDSGGGLGDSSHGWLDHWRAAFNRYVVRYTEKDREQALRDAADGLTSPAFGGTMGVLVLVGVCVVFWRRRTGIPPAAPTAESAQWFDRLLVLLTAHGFTPNSGETPLEFTQGTARTLHERQVSARLAEVPVEWATAYYQTRFGGLTIPPARLSELEAGLEALRQELSGYHGSGS